MDYDILPAVKYVYVVPVVELAAFELFTDARFPVGIVLAPGEHEQGQKHDN
jgi:hypothetical protein